MQSLFLFTGASTVFLQLILSTSLCFKLFYHAFARVSPSLCKGFTRHCKSLTMALQGLTLSLQGLNFVIAKNKPVIARGNRVFASLLLIIARGNCVFASLLPVIARGKAVFLRKNLYLKLLHYFTCIIK